MSYKALIYEKENGVGIVTLSRPERRNALNTVMVEELTKLFDAMGADPEVKVVILTGGDRFFCAGFDLKEQSPTLLYDIRKLYRKIDSFEKPVIAAICGSCLAGGLEMAISCDLRVAAEDSVFGVPEIRFGALAFAGGTQKLPRLIGVTKAKEMHYTGEPIDAREAYRIGLLNRVVPAASVLEEAKKLARTLAERSVAAMRLAKYLIDTGINMDLDSALKLEAEVGKSLFAFPDAIKQEMGKAAQKEDVYKKLFG
ncbi:MAG: enoyl-CoA hydratase/isomerase family protein [Chloroflexi bacterium]|nr:enoyl-CoA hydratase/isomerase family protein [Chloroflexota bacterium]